MTPGGTIRVPSYYRRDYPEYTQISRELKILQRGMSGTTLGEWEHPVRELVGFRS